MGQLLTTLVWPDASKDVIGANDARNDKILGIMWLGSFWAIAMIWSMVLLVDRWRGPLGNRSVGFASVVAAFILSTAWPIVFAFLILSPA